MDTFDRVQEADVEQQGAVAALFAWQAAKAAEKLPPKPMSGRWRPGEVLLSRV